MIILFLGIVVYVNRVGNACSVGVRGLVLRLWV